MAQHIKDLFASLIPYYEPWKINLIENWERVIGDLHEHVALINIQGTMLVLGVYDAAWLQELFILSPVLIKTINDYLGSDYVTNLRFKNIGYKKKERRLEHKISAEKIKFKKRPKPNLTTQENTALTNIQDAGLRDALEGYLTRCKERE